MSSLIARHSNTVVQNHQNVKKNSYLSIIYYERSNFIDFLIIDFDFDKYFYNVYFIIN